VPSGVKKKMGVLQGSRVFLGVGRDEYEEWEFIIVLATRVAICGTKTS
jgi:hypothetical protein